MLFSLFWLKPKTETILLNRINAKNLICWILKTRMKIGKTIFVFLLQLTNMIRNLFNKENQNLVDNLMAKKFLYDYDSTGSSILIFTFNSVTQHIWKKNLFRLRIERMMSALVFQGHCVTYIDKYIKDRH